MAFLFPLPVLTDPVEVQATGRGGRNLPVSGLNVEAVTIERGGHVIIDGLSFSVGAGDALVLTGPNGAGKTTLIRALAGFLTPTSGNIRVVGAGEDPELAALCHYVGHRDAIKPKLTVSENLSFWAAYLGGPANGCDAALEACGLLDLAAVPAAYLSAGQKRRLGLARLLSAPRPIWLLDEPTTSLDAEHQRSFAGLIERHRAGGGMVIAATHMDLGLTGARSLQLTARGAV
jgi:heme exporter protein A